MWCTTMDIENQIIKSCILPLTLLSCRVGLVRLEHMIAQVGPILVHRLIEVTVRYVTRPCTKRTLNTGMIYMGNAFAVEEQIQL